MIFDEDKMKLIAIAVTLRRWIAYARTLLQNMCS